MMNHFTQRRSPLSGKKEPYRTDYEIDKARIIHSEAFRRLQSKTQVLQVSESDFHRNRLTHSVEVAQIGKGIARFIRYQFPEQLRKNAIELEEDLIEAICLAHDIGHPPFGHGGEIALNYMMRNEGGFEGNGQTLRIISKLEKYSEEHGMDLTRRTVLGLLKYPYSLPISDPHHTNEIEHFYELDQEEWKPTKGYYEDEQPVVEWILEAFSKHDQEHFTATIDNPSSRTVTKYKSFDCSIMDLADDISYAVHDFEDGLELGLFDEKWKHTFIDKIFQNKKFMWYLKSFKEYTDQDIDKLKTLTPPKRFISTCIGFFVKHVELCENEHEFQSPYLQYKAVLNHEAISLLDAFKEIVDMNIIRSAYNQRAVKKGQIIVCNLFDVFLKNPDLLPEDTKKKYENTERKYRVISDYIAGMTDRYAFKMYSSIFDQKP
jgi:dGTPase